LENWNSFQFGFRLAKWCTRGSLWNVMQWGFQKAELLSSRIRLGYEIYKGAKRPYGKMPVNKMIKTLRIM
jgi:hypothetical protein